MKIDWTNKDAVIAYARELGSGLSVLQNGKYYNIVHTSRLAALQQGRIVVFNT